MMDEGLDMDAPLHLALPRRAAHRPGAGDNDCYWRKVYEWCAAVKELDSRLDFKVGSRGWCYLLEPYGLKKGDFDAAERLMVTCRKKGLLPLDICAEDDMRKFEGLEQLDNLTPREKAQATLDYLKVSHQFYTPFSFWDAQDHYVQLVVEKIGLKSLFAGVCQEFHIPYANGHGWGDLNVRADMMGRFKYWEAKGKRCVLLYCGDLDPMGMKISECLKENMREVEAVGWVPDNLHVDRFGLNEAFVTEHNLTWIDGLATGGQGIVDPKTGKKVKYSLDDPRHPDHWKPYVQEYLHRYCERTPDGTWRGRKVEADAMVVKSAESRALLRATIHQYLSDDAPAAYERALMGYREQARNETIRLVRAWYR